MNSELTGYNLFFKFIETYAPGGFKTIDRGDPLIKELERQMENNDQFFFIADLILMEIFFTSSRSFQLIGVKPADVDPACFLDATHPEDLSRHSHGRTKMFSLAHDLYVAEQGNVLYSTNFKVRNHLGEFANLCFQLYLFYSEVPYKSVFLLTVITNIEFFENKNKGFHFYVGTDFSNFRYPDRELLNMGFSFTAREFEIIMLIKSGLNSEQIAEKLFLSVHTVNTHRRNILAKSDKKTMSDLIYDLLNRRIL